ncbi:MAG TPA: DUF421 domain-containing protein, partial [Pseudomonas sp.]|nr:DUF421 domain-containing protein [Pseudomonas sp.]
LLLYQGQMLGSAMRVARVTEDEVRSAIRSSGFSAIDEVEAVILETDGSFSVINKGSGDSRSSLSGVMTPGPRNIEL